MKRRQKITQHRISVPDVSYKGLSVLIVVLILIAGVYGVLAWSQKIWDTQHRYSFYSILQDGAVAVVSLQPETAQVGVLRLDSHIKTPVVYGYGPYRIGVIEALAKQDKRGDQLLEQSLEHWLGIDLYGRLDGVTVKNKNFSYGYFSFVINNINSKIPKWDLIRLWLLLNQVSGPSENVVDAVDDGFTELLRLPDGSAEYELSKQSIETLSKMLWQDDLVRDSSLSLKVVNSSETVGIANHASGILTNLGYDIINVSDQVNDSNKSVILIDETLVGWEAWILPLQRIFQIPIRVERDVIVEHTVGVVLVLDDDYADFLHNKP